MTTANVNAITEKTYFGDLGLQDPNVLSRRTIFVNKTVASMNETMLEIVSSIDVPSLEVTDRSLLEQSDFLVEEVEMLYTKYSYIWGGQSSASLPKRPVY